MKVKICSACGKHNAASAWYCSICGESLSAITPIEIASGELSLFREEQSIINRIPELLQNLHSSDPAVRRSAAVELGSLRHSNVHIVRALKKAAQTDLDREVRKAANKALSTSAQQEVVLGAGRQGQGSSSSMDVAQSQPRGWQTALSAFSVAFIFGFGFWLTALYALAANVNSPANGSSGLICLIPGWLMAYAIAKGWSLFLMSMRFAAQDFTASLPQAAIRGRFNETGCAVGLTGLLSSFIPAYLALNLLAGG
jgi:hypothetical protein